VPVHDLPSDTPSTAEDPLSPPTRKLLLQSVLHAADLYAPTLPWASTRGWVHALGDEFSAQVVLERQHGLPESTFLIAEDQPARARAEVGFTSSMATPFWDALAAVLPQLQSPCDMIRLNLELWREVAAGADPAAVDTSAQREVTRAWAALPVLLDASTMHAWPRALLWPQSSAGALSPDR
jgi:hypothetical protein